MLRSHKVFENCSFKFWRSSSFRQSMLCSRALIPLCVLCPSCAPSPTPPCPLQQRQYIRLPVLCFWTGSSQRGNPAGDRREGRKEGWSIDSLDSLPEQLPFWNPNWRLYVFSRWPFPSYSLIPGAGNNCSQHLGVFSFFFRSRCVISSKGQYSFWYLYFLNTSLYILTTLIFAIILIWLYDISCWYSYWYSKQII